MLANIPDRPGHPMTSTAAAMIAAIIARLATELGDGGRAASPQRFTLFHAANSICSQKVRAVLAHHRLDYDSHLLNIAAGQTYLPDHVRLRMAGCRAAGLPLVTGHTGSTATAAGGCDPAVVPTLVDQVIGAVVVDSRAICLHIDATVPPAAQLVPPALAAVIAAELAIVDGLPNYQMLFGRPAHDDRRPARLHGADGAAFSLGKVARCDDYLETWADDATLAAAYRAKRAKELDAAQHLFSPAAVSMAHAAVARAYHDLNTRLGAAPGPWLFGENVTLADLFWAVELLRIDNVGAADIWADGRLRHVAGFFDRARQLDSLRAAVLDWPGALY